MNDPLFLLFLGMSIFAVIYAVAIGYMVHQDTKRPGKKSPNPVTGYLDALIKDSNCQESKIKNLFHLQQV